MCVSLGGRLAEEIINGKDNVTTGASNDFQQCDLVGLALIQKYCTVLYYMSFICPFTRMSLIIRINEGHLSMCH